MENYKRNVLADSVVYEAVKHSPKQKAISSAARYFYKKPLG